MPDQATFPTKFGGGEHTSPFVTGLRRLTTFLPRTSNFPPGPSKWDRAVSCCINVTFVRIFHLLPCKG